jgi:flagellar assembly factor FliW
MPLVHTRRFGVLECADSSILTFASGPPGFADQTRFALVEQPDLAPVVFLQSLHSAELCFLAAPATVLLADYDLAMTREDLERLGLSTSRQPTPGREVLCLALLCAPENGPMTANLLAPVVVNRETRAAVQAVRADARYSHQHPVGAGRFFAAEPAEAGDDAC